MFKRIIKLFNHTSETMYDGALIIATCTMLGHLLAIFRDRAFAHTFGASTTLDIYFAAFRVPDILFTIGSTLIGSAILLPYLTPHAQNEAKIKEVANDIFTVFAIGFFVILIATFIAMPWIMKIFAKGFSAEDYTTLVSLSRVLLLSPLLLGISNLLGTLTQSLQKFFVSSLAPVVYNIGIIIGVVALYPIFGIYGLAYGVIIGALLHIGIQIPTLIKTRMVPHFVAIKNWHMLRQIMCTALPRTFTLSTNKIELFLLTALGLTIAEGTVSVFNLTWNLQNAPLALVGASIVLAVFPLLIRSYTNNDSEQFETHLTKALKTIMFWTIPITVGIIVFGRHITQLILGTGAFDINTVSLATAALATFVIALPSQTAILAYVRALYAQGDTWRPFWANLIASTIPVLAAWAILFTHTDALLFGWIYKIFNIETIAGHQVVVLTTVYAVGNWIGHGILWYLCRNMFTKTNYHYWNHIMQCMFAAAMFAAGAIAGMFIVQTGSIHPIHEMLYQVIIGGSLGAVAWMLLLYSMRNDEFMYMLQQAKNRLIRKIH